MSLLFHHFFFEKSPHLDISNETIICCFVMSNEIGKIVPEQRMSSPDTKPADLPKLPRHDS